MGMDLTPVANRSFDGLIHGHGWEANQTPRCIVIDQLDPIAEIPDTAVSP
jgi:hypothetical protein